MKTINETNEQKEVIVKKRTRPVSLLKGLLIGLIIGLLIGTAFGLFAPEKLKDWASEKFMHTHQNVEEGKHGRFTAIDFQEAILGELREEQELVVMEQDIDYVSTITKAGFQDWAVFRKTKNITFSGTGVYTLDLSGITADKILVDEESKTVTLLIPRTTLKYVVMNPESMTFEDTEKGLLSFGDLQLTAEKQAEFETLAKKAMTEKLSTAERFRKADELAQMKCWEIYQPIVDTISGEYRLATRFE